MVSESIAIHANVEAATSVKVTTPRMRVLLKHFSRTTLRFNHARLGAKAVITAVFANAKAVQCATRWLSPAPRMARMT